MVNIGETVIVRDDKYNKFLNGSKTFRGREYLEITIDRLCEDIRDLLWLEVEKISARKWQLMHITTEENSYYMGDDNITFSSKWYNLKVFENATIQAEWNELCGEWKELAI